MAATIYDIGDVVRCAGTVTANGTAIDPGTVTGRWQIDPGGSVTSYVYGTDPELVKASTGEYYFDLTIAAEGRYLYRIEGTGTNAAAQGGVFLVRGNEFD